MIDNNSAWTIWCMGWACFVAAAYLQGGYIAALVVLGTGLLRASGITQDNTLSSVLSALLAYIKPGAVK